MPNVSKMHKMQISFHIQLNLGASVVQIVSLSHLQRFSQILKLEKKQKRLFKMLEFYSGRLRF